MWLTKLRPVFGNGLRSSQILFKKHEIFNLPALMPIPKCNHRRTYKNFGHRNDPPDHPLKRFYLLSFMSLVLIQFINWDQ